MSDVPTRFSSADERDAAICRIQRFINTRQDVFGLDTPLTLTGELDEQTRIALHRAHEASVSYGKDQLPNGLATEADIAGLNHKLLTGTYSYGFDRLMIRYPRDGDAQHQQRWWNSLQCLLAENGTNFSDHVPAKRQQIAAALAGYVAHNTDGNFIGWLGSEGDYLPEPIRTRLEPILAAKPGLKTVRALDGYQHLQGNGSPLMHATKVITYNFMVPGSDSPESKHHKTPDMLSPQSQALFEEVLREYEQMCDVRFQRVQLPQKAEMQIYMDEGRAKAEQPNWHGKVPLRSRDEPVYVMLNQAVGKDLTNPDHARWVMLHEVGHVMGMKHAHTPATDYGKRLQQSMDNINHSVMSYFYAWRQSMPDSPMGLDAKWVQEKYRPTRLGSGDARSYQVSGNATAPVRRTLVDNDAAVDWLDASASEKPVRLDLRGGVPQHSQIGTHKIWIAEGSRIEGAIGGAGDDVLIAGAGESYLKGGDGRDRFEIGLPGHHRILDMQVQDVLAIGKELRSQKAQYVEQPWGVKVTLQDPASKVRTDIDIVTMNNGAALKQVRKQLPQIQENTTMALLGLKLENPNQQISPPRHIVELDGNKSLRITPAGVQK